MMRQPLMLTLTAETLGPAPKLSEWPLDGRLSTLVASRFDMDDDEAHRFALACGNTVAATAGPASFDRHLRDVIRRYWLTNLFQDVGSGRHHQAIKPTGYDHGADGVIPEGMAQWRAIYRALPEPHQMMAATIIWLYRGGRDMVWLRRVAVAWPAAYAVAVLHEDGALADWGLLIALYPGW
jgi:hypothetical protein